MRILLLAFLTVLFLSGPALAQPSDCGNGLPCGPVPWRMPVLPKLSSPTPMPTLQIPESSINPGDPTPTPAPIPSPTPLGLDTEEIGNRLNTIGLLIQQTPALFDDSFSLRDEILVDEDFQNWSGSCVVGWVCFQSPPNSEVNQVPEGIQIIRVSSAGYARTGSVLTIGNKYNFIIVIEEITGAVLVGSLTGGGNNPINTAGLHSGVFTASSESFAIQAQSNGSSVIVSSVIVQLNNDTFDVLETNAETFFSYARGLSEDNFGPFAPLVSLTLVSLVVIVTVKITTFALPLLAALFGIIRKVIVTILEFLPL